MKLNQYYDFFKSYYIRHGYELHDIEPFAIRNLDGLKSDGFNDIIGTVSHSKKEVNAYRGTTDPGAFYIRRGGIPGTGAPFVCSGYHKDIFCVGNHKDYEALVNSSEYCQPISFIRDSNRNFILDDSEKIQREHIGTNLHHAGVDSQLIGKWSAGCQVIAKLKDFYEFMRNVKDESMYRDYVGKTLYSYNIFEIEEAKEIYNFFYNIKKIS